MPAELVLTTVHPIAKATIDVNVTVEFAYTFVSDLTKMSEWFPGVHSISIAKDTADHPPRDFVEYVAFPLFGTVEVPLRLTEMVPNKKLGVKNDYPLLHPQSEIVFESLENNASRLHWRMDSRREGNRIWRIFFPIAQWIMSNRGKQALKNLKFQLEKRYQLES